VAISVSNRPTDGTIGAFTDFNHLIESKRISLAISLLKGSSSSGRVGLLAEIFELDRDDLVLLIDHLEEVFLYLEDVSSILVAVVIYEVAGFETMAFTSNSNQAGAHWLVIVRLQLQLVGDDPDLLLALIEDN